MAAEIPILQIPLQDEVVNVKYFEQVKPWIFDPKKMTWVDINCKKSYTNSTLTIVTLNVWFDSFRLKERTKEQINILKQLDPDIICLQESKLIIIRKILYK